MKGIRQILKPFYQVYIKKGKNQVYNHYIHSAELNRFLYCSKIFLNRFQYLVRHRNSDRGGIQSPTLSEFTLKLFNSLFIDNKVSRLFRINIVQIHCRWIRHLSLNQYQVTLYAFFYLIFLKRMADLYEYRVLKKSNYQMPMIFEVTLSFE